MCPVHCVHDYGHRNRGLVPLLAFKFQRNKVLVPHSLVWDRARPQTTGARILSPVSGGQSHLIYLTILRRFSWPSLAYILCAQRWPTIPFIYAFWVMNKQENVHGSREFFSWNDEFLKIHFKLDDIFRDSSELKESWDPGEDHAKSWNCSLL